MTARGLRIVFRDKIVEEFPHAVSYTEVLGKTILWKRKPPHPEITQHEDIIDSLSTDFISRIEPM